MAPTSRIVGIDLGTTHTVVAWSDLDHVQPTLFPIPQLSARAEVEALKWLPSFLYAVRPDEATLSPHDRAPFIAGEYARKRGREVPGRLIASTKSWLCYPAVDRTAKILPWGESADEVDKISPVQASARLLEHAKSAYDAAFSPRRMEQELVVLTVPASFDQAARELTLRAARQAGLDVRLLEEPQAAFYDYLSRAGEAGVLALLERTGGKATILVCDIGGGTTDLSLIAASRRGDGSLALDRIAVGRHLLLGGDNIDLALAHRAEAHFGARLDPARFGQLALVCRDAKEQLLSEDAPESVKVTVLGAGSDLFASTLGTELSREEVEQLVLDGFFPVVAADAEPERTRAGLVAFGLPYERDARVTAHIAGFLKRHASEISAPDAVLFNGGLFHAPRIRQRLIEILESWRNDKVSVLDQPDPDLAVARGAVAFGLSLMGRGIRIGGGSAHGYYLGLASERGLSHRAICVVPRGSKEGERHVLPEPELELTVGQPVRFDLFAADSGPVDAPGQIVAIDADRFELLPPVATTLQADEKPGQTVPVYLEGELSAIGTLELSCVERRPVRDPPQHFRLAFELRGSEASMAPTSRRVSDRPTSSRGFGPNFNEACEAIQRVFGKGRSDVHERETRDLLRELERLLGERAKWTTELARALFDVVGPKHRSRRRSADHERVYWMLSGYCLRPGFGHPLDASRIRWMAPLFAEGVTHGDHDRNWQQFFIAWRRMAGGLDEQTQIQIRDLLDPWLAPPELKLKRPKGFKPPASFEAWELASWLERVPVDRRAELGRWILERTWTDRDPRLWELIGRVGARVPAYASVHHVLNPRTVERWLDHLLREKWTQSRLLTRSAMMLARVTGDRARDVSDSVRSAAVRQLEQAGAPAEWIKTVRELVPVAEAERAEWFGEDLPIGLRLVQ